MHKVKIENVMWMNVDKLFIDVYRFMIQIYRLEINEGQIIKRNCQNKQSIYIHTVSPSYTNSVPLEIMKI